MEFDSVILRRRVRTAFVFVYGDGFDRNGSESEKMRCIRHQEEILRETMSPLEHQERRRSEIMAAVDQAEASFSSGTARRISTQEECRHVADAVKRRGLARLQAQLAPTLTTEKTGRQGDKTSRFVRKLRGFAVDVDGDLSPLALPEAEDAEGGSRCVSQHDGEPNVSGL